MKQTMQGLAPTVLQNMKAIPTQSIDSNIQGSPSGRLASQGSLSCAGLGEIFDTNTFDANQRCGK